MKRLSEKLADNVELTSVAQDNNSIPKQPGMYVSVQTTAFSGATLLAFLLGAHPQIATIGEMDGLLNVVDYDNYLCSCGQKMRLCGFWQSIACEMERRGFEFDIRNFDTMFTPNGSKLERYLKVGSTRIAALDAIRDAVLYAWPGEKQRLAHLVARNDALIDSVLAVTGKEIFVDTSKGALRLKAMRRWSRHEVRVIHMVRDVRGVVASNLKRNSALDAQTAARQWVKQHQRHQRTLSSLPPDAYVTLRYEDLCEDPSTTLEEVYRFCGVAPTSEAVDFRAGSHHIIGNKMRLKAQSEIKLDERWKHTLTDEQIIDITTVAGKLGRQYKYV